MALLRQEERTGSRTNSGNLSFVLPLRRCGVEASRLEEWLPGNFHILFRKVC
jgi:hypothetical protein